MKKFKIVAALLIFMTFYSGCTSIAEVTMVNDELPPQGLILSMPYGLLQIKLDYEIIQKETWPADDEGNPKKNEESSIEISIKITDYTIETIIVPDQELKFVFEPSDLNKFTKTSDLSLEFMNSSILKSTNLDIKDKAGEMITSFSEAAINIGKIGINSIRGKTASEIRTETETLSVIIDISDLNWKDSDSNYSRAKVNYELFSGIIAEEKKVINLVLYFKSRITSEKIKTDPIMNLKDSKISGIPYRSGGALLIETNINSEHITDNFVILPQLGPIGIITYKSKPFSDTIQSITFSNKSATLTEYKITNTSSGEDLSLLLSSITSELNTNLKTLRENYPELFMNSEELSQKEELQNLTHQLSLYQAMLEVEEAKQELEELNNK